MKSKESDRFSIWACDPARTLEERFGALMLIEATYAAWYYKVTGEYARGRYEYLLEVNHKRYDDPGFQPEYDESSARHAEEMLPETLALRLGGDHFRPIRDVTFLRFCGALENLALDESQVVDWSPIASLTSLRELSITERSGRDFRPLGALVSLKNLRLVLFQPWPDLRGMEKLASLEKFTYRGNLLALGAIPSLPQVRTADLDEYVFKVPLRQVTEIPEMPELRNLTLKGTCGMEGIERHPQLLNLEVHGNYTDLQNLESLKHLTHLRLQSTEVPEISSLEKLPSLCQITFDMEIPPELTPLAHAPRLHEIFVVGTPIVPAELAVLNSFCEPWDREFAFETPRPLKPLKARLYQDREIRNLESPAEIRDWGDNDAMAKSEGLWFVRRLNRRLNRLLGKGWGALDEKFPRSPGQVMITITRPQDIDRLVLISKALRKLFASARYPWHCTFKIDSLAHFQRDIEDDEKDEDEFDSEMWLRETKEWHDKAVERREFLKRKYLHDLSMETGIPLPPAPPPKPDDEPEEGSGIFGSDEDSDEDEFESFLTEQPEYDLGTSLSLYVILNETHLYFQEHTLESAEMLFEMKAEE